MLSFESTAERRQAWIVGGLDSNSVVEGVVISIVRARFKNAVGDGSSTLRCTLSLIIFDWRRAIEMSDELRGTKLTAIAA
jgi:hypothetical protein